MVLARVRPVALARLVAGLALLALVAGSPVLPAAPAAADVVGDGGVQVSRDGLTWAPVVDGALFSPALAWQPGDVRTSTLWVRNDTGADTAVDVVLTRAPGGSGDALVSTSARVPGQDWVTVEPGGPAGAVRVDTLADGASAVVTLRTSLDAAAPVGTTVDTSLLDVVARPADASAPGNPVGEAPSGPSDPSGDASTSASPSPGARGTAGGDPDDGWLSSAQLELAPIFLGFALVVAVVVGRRRRHQRP